MPRQLQTLAIFVIAALVTVGCGQTRTFTPDNPAPTATGTSGAQSKTVEVAASRDEPVRVVLMPTDIELYEMTAAGLLDPKADWSISAQEHVARAVEAVLSERNVTLADYAEPPTGSEDQRLHVQLVKLHAAVGNTILLHGFTQQVTLPSKKNLFDWTLGPDARVLRENTDADYALFVFVRDSYTTAGRAAVILAAAVLGVGITGGQQVGFASLIDLETGNVEWFNALHSGTGDLRTAEPARDTVDNLLTDLPL